MLAEPARILIDLEAVEFIDAAGIGALTTAVESAQADHEELRLRRPSPAVRRVLDILHLDGSLPLEETLAGSREVVADRLGGSNWRSAGAGDHLSSDLSQFAFSRWEARTKSWKASSGLRPPWAMQDPDGVVDRRSETAWLRVSLRA